MTRDQFRLAAWLAAGLLLYALAYILAPFVAQPGNAGLAAIQTALWKAGHVTTFAWIGYRIARAALGRIASCPRPYARAPKQPDPHIVPRLIARAIVIGAAILAGALGL